MWTLLIGGVVGLCVAGSRAPKTPSERKKILGAKTGVTYHVDDFKDAGVIVVSDNRGAMATFVRNSTKQPGAIGFSFLHGRGPRGAVLGMVRDLCGDPKPQPVASDKAPAPSAQKTG